MKRKDCSSCYVKIKRYTPIFGIIVTLVLCVPIINLLIMNVIFKSLDRYEAWEDIWYEYKTIKITQFKK